MPAAQVPDAGAHPATSQQLAPTSTRIPATVHQIMGLYDDWKHPDKWTPPKDLQISFLKPGTLDCMQSWVDLNPGWTYKLWDRTDVAALLQKYPQYQETWKTLPKDVERGDFIRCGRNPCAHICRCRLFRSSPAQPE